MMEGQGYSPRILWVVGPKCFTWERSERACIVTVTGALKCHSVN